MPDSEINSLAGLERRHLMKQTRKGVSRDTLKPADPEPEDEDKSNDGDTEHVIDVMPVADDPDDVEHVIDEVPDADDADLAQADPRYSTLEATVAAMDEETAHAPGWVDDISFKFNDLMMKTALETYQKAYKIMNPEDPRMKEIESALWTWLLKIIYMIDNARDSPDVTSKLHHLAKQEPFKQLRGMVYKAQVQELNAKEWTQYGKLIEDCSNMFIRQTADAIVCTTAQLASPWSKDVKFAQIITDEGTVMNEPQHNQSWRGASNFLFIGDQAQLGVTTLSKPKENPFSPQLKHPPYVRYVENNWPYAMLLEVMRMTTGLEALCSDIFYDGQLKPGPGTAIDHPSRQMSRVWRAQIRDRYPTLTNEPEGLTYPILLNITSDSEPESACGTSLVNKFNVSAATEHICWAIKAGIVKADQIGVATPYAAQVHLYTETLAKIGKSQPDLQTEQIQVGVSDFWSKDLSIGTSEWWQGRQADYMIVDLVRATNDAGELGFMSDSRRLNVLLSRQRQALVIVGDKDCTKIMSTDANDIRLHESRNSSVAKVFQWLETKGRVIDLVSNELSQDFITFDAAGASLPNDDHTEAAGGWVDEVPAQTTEGDWGDEKPALTTEGGWEDNTKADWDKVSPVKSSNW